MQVVLNLENKIVEFILNKVSELIGLPVLLLQGQPVLRVGSEDDYREDG